MGIVVTTGDSPAATAALSAPADKAVESTGMLQQNLATRVARPWMLDAFLVLATATVNLVGTLLVAQHQPQTQPLDLGGVALLLAAPAALWWRRSHPALVLLGCFVVTTTFLWLPYPEGPVYGPQIVALITAVIAGRRLAAYTVVVAAVLASVWQPTLLGEDSSSLARAAGDESSASG